MRQHRDQPSAMPTEPARETHTVREACARLGVGKTLGYELARAGTFPVPVIKVGRRLLVSRTAVDRLLASAGKEEPTAVGPTSREGRAHPTTGEANENSR